MQIAYTVSVTHDTYSKKIVRFSFETGNISYFYM